MVVEGTAQASLIVDLATVVDDYARNQHELLEILRQFRSVHLEPPARPASTQTPSAPGVTHRHRAFLPPPPHHRAPEVVRLPPPPPRAATTTALSGGAWGREMLGSSVHATKRDYDYFDELDRKLTRRPAGPAPS